MLYIYLLFILFSVNSALKYVGFAFSNVMPVTAADVRIVYFPPSIVRCRLTFITCTNAGLL